MERWLVVPLLLLCFSIRHETVRKTRMGRLLKGHVGSGAQHVP